MFGWDEDEQFGDFGPSKHVETESTPIPSPEQDWVAKRTEIGTSVNDGKTYFVYEGDNGPQYWWKTPQKATLITMLISHDTPKGWREVATKSLWKLVAHPDVEVADENIRQFIR